MFVGDIHLNCGGFTPYVRDALNNVLQIALEEEPDKLVFLGDFLDSPVLTPDLTSEMSERMSWFVSNIKNVYMLRGNHDRMPRYQSSSIDFLYRQRVITKFDIMETDRMILISHSHSGVTVNPKNKIVAAHLGMSGIQVREGYEYNNSDVLTLEGKAEAIILGHIHTPTKIMWNETPLFVPGSICPTNWSDSSDQRFVVIVEDDNIRTRKIDHIFTKTVYSEEDIDPEDDTTIFRLVTTKEVDTSQYENVKSVVVKKDIKPITKNLTKDSLIEQYCKQYNTNINKIKKILVEAGVHA